MGYKRIPENPAKPICMISGYRGKYCIVVTVWRALKNAGQYALADEWQARCYGQRLNYKRRLLLAHKYVEVR